MLSFIGIVDRGLIACDGEHGDVVVAVHPGEGRLGELLQRGQIHLDAGRLQAVRLRRLGQPLERGALGCRPRLPAQLFQGGRPRIWQASKSALGPQSAGGAGGSAAEAVAGETAAEASGLGLACRGLACLERARGFRAFRQMAC